MTVDLIKEVRFDGAYTFKYSARANTKAWEIQETVSDEEKGRRVFEIAELQHEISLELNKRMIGTTERILVEGPSRKSPEEYTGRTDTNKSVVFPCAGERVGEYIDIKIERANSATLFGRRPADPDELNEEQAA
jgi:tRNA-2-methylthio-N6-dimethylallyladenosine synthase